MTLSEDNLIYRVRSLRAASAMQGNPFSATLMLALEVFTSLLFKFLKSFSFLLVQVDWQSLQNSIFVFVLWSESHTTAKPRGCG